MPKISIIIPSYNQAHTLGLLLESIREQEGGEFEVVIIDNESTDGTEKVVSGSSIDDILFVSEQDSGIYDAMNKGIKCASTQWVMFMGADDILYDKFVIKDISEAIDSCNDCEVVFGNIIFDNGRIRSSEMSKKIIFINTIHHQSAVYKKDIFDKFKYNDQYKISSDYELNLLIYINKIKSYKIDRIISKVSLGGTSDKVNISGYFEEIFIRNKYIDSYLIIFVANFITIFRFLIKYLLSFFSINPHYYNK